MNLDDLLWLAGILAEAALVGMLAHRRAWRTLPSFCVFCAWDLACSVTAYPVGHFAPQRYAQFYFLETAISLALEFSILIELAWSVLRPIRKVLPQGTLPALGVLVLVAGAAIWPFSGLHELGNIRPMLRNLVHLQQTASILRILFFLALTGCSQQLSIGWRDRELQVATGLGFYSLFGLGAAMLHTHQTTYFQYTRLNELVIGSYIVSVIYWTACFTQQEAARREFTPQMQSLLLAVAGVARANRTVLSGSAVTNVRRRRDD